MGDEEQKNKDLSFDVIFTPDKKIPKLCTQVLFSLGSDGKIFITFVFRERADEEGIVIERIMLTDNKQAKQFIEKLGETIEKSEKIIQEKA